MCVESGGVRNIFSATVRINRLRFNITYSTPLTAGHVCFPENHLGYIFTVFYQVGLQVIFPFFNYTQCFNLMLEIVDI